VGRQGLEVRFFKRFELRDWPRQCLLMAALAIIVAGATVLTIWTFYCFRYNAYIAAPPTSFPKFRFGDWTSALSSVHDQRLTAVVGFFRRHHLLPEGFLYGLTITVEGAYYRQNFLAGHYDPYGSPWYFPFCLAVKMPLGLFVILALAGAAIVAGLARANDRTTWVGRLASLTYLTTPMWTLLLVYWVSAIKSHINIGFRHVMPTLPATCIFAGAAAAWWSARGRWPVFSRGATAAVWLSAAWFAGESLAIHPYYLSYFNELVGGPSQGYHYLVDSSLDWGQDLPALSDWLKQERPKSEPVILAYFGQAQPAYYGIEATAVPLKYARLPERAMDSFIPGIYCISATYLQGVYQRFQGPWNAQFESRYQQGRLFEWHHNHRNEPESKKWLAGIDEKNYLPLLNDYEALRFSRLCR